MENDEKELLSLHRELRKCDKEYADLYEQFQQWTFALDELYHIEGCFEPDLTNKLSGKTILDIGTYGIKPLYIALKFDPKAIIGINEELSEYASDIESNGILLCSLISFLFFSNSSMFFFKESSSFFASTTGLRSSFSLTAVKRFSIAFFLEILLFLTDAAALTSSRTIWRFSSYFFFRKVVAASRLKDVSVGATTFFSFFFPNNFTEKFDYSDLPFIYYRLAGLFHRVVVSSRFPIKYGIKQS